MISSVFILVPEAFHLDQHHDTFQEDFSSLFCVVLHVLPLSLCGLPYLSCLGLPHAGFGGYHLYCIAYGIHRHCSVPA